MPADYHVWKKLPTNAPSERIARYGQGFSKILSTLRDDTTNQHTNSSVMQTHVHDKMSLHHQSLLSH